MPIFLLLNLQIYQALEILIMNYRVHYFHNLGLSYLYRIKAMSLVDYICKKKSHVYMYIKKTSAKLSRASNPSLGKWKCVSFISFILFYKLGLRKHNSNSQGLT